MVFESLCPFCESRASFVAHVRRGRLTQAWGIRCASCGGALPLLNEPELRHARALPPEARGRISAALRELPRPVLLSFAELVLLGDGGRRANERRLETRARRRAPYHPRA